MRSDRRVGQRGAEQASQPIGRFRDFQEIKLALVVELKRGILEEQIRVSANGHQRRADIVADNSRHVDLFRLHCSELGLQFFDAVPEFVVPISDIVQFRLTGARRA